MAENRYHITKRGEGWAVKKEGNQRASKIYDSKDIATSNAQKYRKGNDIIIHKKDGSIEKWQKKK